MDVLSIQVNGIFDQISEVNDLDNVTAGSGLVVTPKIRYNRR